MTHEATKTEIRTHYTDQGYEVKIDRDGHVTYRENADDPWLEGRWVSEYRVIDGQVVLL